MIVHLLKRRRVEYVFPNNFFGANNNVRVNVITENKVTNAAYFNYNLQVMNKLYYHVIRNLWTIFAYLWVRFCDEKDGKWLMCYICLVVMYYSQRKTYQK